MAYFHGDFWDIGQVWIRELDDGRSRKLTRANQNLLRSVELGEIEEVWFEGPVGNDLQGWILKPPDFDPQKKYPSILEIHGGPSGQYGNFFMHEFYYLTAHGYVVYFCGSTRLQPSETVRLQTLWNRRDQDGFELPAGRYLVRGTVRIVDDLGDDGPFFSGMDLATEPYELIIQP